ncbi:hypothetical protein B0A54_13348 [Friedmanniomyces endolithicus]|uniref:RAVE subunit 2/Rogdi n=1 Tax=Friedmanniomyces endolithicus TaxID=329885 RepID=A0A4U0UGQ6_9PEZI|nr:hypothetical protein B0A54_13348 [Friedmanniomyces endolithicus]
MSTLVWPQIAAPELIKEEESTLARELAWILSSLQDTLQSLKAGLEECAALLAPSEPGSTLVLSSLRSEKPQGLHYAIPVPRGQPSYKLSISTQPTAPTLALEQLTTTRTLINACLDVVDATRWTGDATNADFISGQIRLLHENIQEAKAALKGWTPSQKLWYDDPVDPAAFTPALPANLSFHLCISEAAVLVHVRTLEATGSNTGTSTPHSVSANPGSVAAPSYTGFSIRDRLAGVLGGGKQVVHDEAHEVFVYKGQEVRVKEKVRVESQDPSLMAAMAKLGALERNVALARRALDVVMGRDGEEG